MLETQRRGSLLPRWLERAHLDLDSHPTCVQYQQHFDQLSNNLRSRSLWCLRSQIHMSAATGMGKRTLGSGYTYHIGELTIFRWSSSARLSVMKPPSRCFPLQSSNKLFYAKIIFPPTRFSRSIFFFYTSSSRLWCLQFDRSHLSSSTCLSIAFITSQINLTSAPETLAHARICSSKLATVHAK